MKKEQREIYIELTELCGAMPCLACKYAEFEGCGSLCDGGDGYYICNHPVINLSFINKNEEDPEPGADCIGLTPKTKLDTLSELASTIIQNHIQEWAITLKKDSFEMDSVQYEGNEPKYTRYQYNIPVVTK